MDVTKNRMVAASLAAALVGLAAAPSANAGPNRAVEACKTAIAAEQGDEVVSRLKQVRPRGSAYEAWFNVSDGDTELKAYCLNKRSGTELVTSEGSWTGSKLKRPQVG